MAEIKTLENDSFFQYTFQAEITNIENKLLHCESHKYYNDTSEKGKPFVESPLYSRNDSMRKVSFTSSF